MTRPDPALALSSAISKSRLRLLPFLILMYILAFIDRSNVGFAKAALQADTGLGDAAFAFGASIFFVGYAFFEVPSNYMLHRLGAKVWLCRIMVTWGLVSAAMMFAHNAETFYVLRFMLGVAEAGFFPGIILYLTYWFPAQSRGQALGLFYFGLPLALVLGSPLSGWLMNSMQGVQGLSGWQWMLIIEGIPSIIMAFVVIVCLADNIDKAKWLSAAEKALLKANLQSDNQGKATRLSEVFFNPRVWLLVLILLTFNTGFYGLAFWMPSIIKSTGITNSLHIGLLTAIPYAVATVAMLLNARHSNRTGERRLHAAIPAFIGGVGLILSAFFADNLLLSVLFLSVAASGILSLMPIFWTLPGTVLSGVAAAAGIGMINAIGNLSGFTGSMITAVAENLTGNINNGTYVLALCLFVSGGLILAIPAAMLGRKAKAADATAKVEGR